VRAATHKRNAGLPLPISTPNLNIIALANSKLLYVRSSAGG